MGPVPRLRNVRDASAFEALVSDLSEGFSTLDYDSLREELRSLSISLAENPGVETLSAEMQQVQAMKDRVSAMLNDAVDNYLTQKRVAEILVKGWPVLSSGTSQDKREAEAQLKLAEFLFAATEAESYYRAVMGALKNLDSQHEAISRQITCHQMTSNLYEHRVYDRQDQSTDGSASREQDVYTDWEAFE